MKDAINELLHALSDVSDQLNTSASRDPDFRVLSKLARYFRYDLADKSNAATSLRKIREVIGSVRYQVSLPPDAHDILS